VMRPVTTENIKSFLENFVMGVVGCI